MDLSAKYDPALTEDKWYAYWLKYNFFHSEPDEREPYTIVIPPPNVTGVLHMGHMLNNTIQDVLIRRARMTGKNACWVPGTDHASIATEAKVVAKLKSEGIEKSDITRDEFLRHAWDWREKHGGIILEQLKKLGASCDWKRTKFTMDPDLSKAVINTFVYYYKKGWIYRGVRMVNWDPAGQTAVSDEEVIRRETKSRLYYLKYYISEGGAKTENYITIATTRPETIMADTAVCVHPMDERYRHLKGKKVLIPLIDKEIPVIEDEYVTMDFGTGCLKITPAHDINDYEIGIRHRLPVVDILDNHARLNEKAVILVGEDRFVAREKIVRMLNDAGMLEKEEQYVSQIGYSERTDSVIEPRLSLQWFLKMDKAASNALDYVESEKVKLIPDKYRNTYRHWMENVKDWCISRQLWWGQRIPAWYLPDGSFVVEADEQKALEAARKADNSLELSDLKQDEDVLDTWFSSWLWPVSVFDAEKPGFPEKAPNKDLAYYFPTNDLVTAPEILFFWVARMVMASDEFCGNKPFSNVYLTGTVRDKLGRKMSKSLGNSPDPIRLMEQYGADGVRVGMMLCSSAGNDILFDESQVEQGRNFSNKIWNAYRLVRGWKPDPCLNQTAYSEIAVKWFSNLLSYSEELVNDHFDKFRISDALMVLYKLFWDDFCAFYLEIIKPAYGKDLDKQTYDCTVQFFDSLLKLLHPFMPFITEELWQNISGREEGESIMVQQQPIPCSYSSELLTDFETVKEIIANIRNIRQNKGISPKEKLELVSREQIPSGLLCIVEKMANINFSKGDEDAGKDRPGINFMVKTSEYFVPVDAHINVEDEVSKIDLEIRHLEAFLFSVNKKLSNEKFVAGAPKDVVALEYKKQSDAGEKIGKLRRLREQMTGV
jgi:valyl-tRNA synthetase